MAEENEARYPSQYQTELLLKDGSRISIRPIKKGDSDGCLSFVRQLSPRTKYLTFHHFPNKIEKEDAVRFCSVNYHDAFALVAEAQREPHDGNIVALGRYYRLPNTRSAEVTITIGDEYQGKGIGTGLVKSLANIARDNGITTFEADILSENEEMLRVLRDYGFHVSGELRDGTYRVTFPITRTRRIARKEEERDLLSTMASLRAILSPKSVAVIGASREPGTIGRLLVQCIVQNGFSGTVYPVNPNAESILSVKTYPSVLDIPGEVELAIIAVPAPIVAKVADECGRKGVRALIVISDGFRERGPEGAAREKELWDVALGHGMRIVGPNCMGVINTDPAVSLNGTFSPVYPPRGSVAFLTQSGAIGLVILQYAKDLNMGISTFVSVGNRTDISADDLLQYWEQDPATRVILLYMESFGNPQKFGRIARRVSAKKPIVAVKSGTTPFGLRAATSHTGAMATSDIASQALFRQAGITRVDTMENLFDVAALLSNQPLPKGKRLAIVTNGGGPGIIAADAAANNGLILPSLSVETISKLKSVITRSIQLGNPLDTTAGATAKEFDGVLRILANDKDNDAVLAIFIPPVVIDTGDIEKAISDVAPLYWRQGKPLLACFFGQHGFKTGLGYQGKFVPCYPFPEQAISALAKAVEYSEMRCQPHGTIPRLHSLKRERARKIIEAALTRSTQRPFWLSTSEIIDLLGCYGLHFVETLRAGSASAAVAAAREIGFPVAVKLFSATITHKTDVGGVVLDLNSPEDVERAFHAIRDKLTTLGRESEMEGVIVQPMVKEGVEVIVGVSQDPSLGALIMLGSGGIYAELIKDVAVRLHPLTDLDARELVRSIKMAKLFEGFRGSPPSDTESLQDLLLRLSAMIEGIPQITELDFNPVKVMPQGQGYRILDARIMVK